MADAPKTPISVLTPIDQRNTDQLLDLLKQLAATPNILTLEEFRRFSILYTTPADKQTVPAFHAGLRHLAQEFEQKIDFYKPTHVVVSRTDPTILLRLPQILTPLRALSETDQNTKAINANYTYRFSDLPRVWSSAQNQMTSALFAEQTAPEHVSMLAQVKAETKVIMAEFQTHYGKEPVQETSSNTSVRQSTEEDFEDL